MTGHYGQGCVFARGEYDAKKKKLLSGSWWIKYYRDGKSFAESAHSLVKADAEALLKSRQGEIAVGQFISPSERKIRVDEIAGDVITWIRNKLDKHCDHPEQYADACQSKWDMHLSGFFSGMRADQISTDQLTRYRDKRMSDKEKPSVTTVNRELQLLRKAYKLAISRNKLQRMPKFEMAKEDNARKTFISEEDKQKLRDAASRDTARKTAKMKGLHLKCFVELLFAYGWRKGELTGLEVKNVELDRKVLRIETSKSGEGREVPLTASLTTLLTPLVIGRKPDEQLFPAKDLRWAWKRLCKEGGVQAGRSGYIMHDARRTTARAKRSAGVAESVTSKTMGWRPGSKMFERYGIVDTADMLTAQERQEQWEAQQRKTGTKQLQSAIPHPAGQA